MLNHMIGEYIRLRLGGSVVNLTWQETLLADQVGSLTFVDAENGASLLTKASNGDFYLIDCYAYADPGFVTIDLVPDSDTNRKIRVDAHKMATRIPFILPILVEVDVELIYTNESIVNNLYMNLSALYLSKDKVAEFQKTSEDLLDAFFAMSSAIQSAAPVSTTAYGTAGGTGKERCKRAK